MPTAPLRPDESDRLRVLRDLNILDTEPEERFDRLTRLATTATGVPTALVSLVDTDRQWFKSHTGLDVCQTSRANSFCSYVVLNRQPVIITDATTDPRTADMTIVTEDPHIRAYAGFPLFNPTGHCFGSLCIIDYRPREFSPRDLEIVRDLAHLAESELNDLDKTKLIADLAIANELATRATEAQLRLTATVGHEIRTALNGIVGVSELLASGDPIEESAEVLQASSRSLLALIDDLLDYAKLEGDGLQVRPVPTSIAAVASTVIQTVRLIAKDGVEVRLDLSPNLPEWVECDPHRLRQILLNLLGNAAKFTIQGRIDLGIRPLPDAVEELEFTISDSGEGLTPLEAARIFEPFAQANAGVAQRVGGTGLGLTISRRLVEKMGGEIDFVSTKDVGSTFIFSVTAPATQAPESLPPAAKTLPTPALRLIVAEDNRTNQRLLGAMLKKLGHAADFVTSGREIVERLAAETHWDAALMDVGLPDLDGLAATREIRRGEGERGQTPIPIIAITANADARSRSECGVAGMTGFLPKPITLNALKSALAREI